MSLLSSGESNYLENSSLFNKLKNKVKNAKDPTPSITISQIQIKKRALEEFKSLNYMELNCLEYAVNMSLFEIEKLIRLKPYEIKNYDHLLELYTVLTEESFSKFVEILKNFKIVRKYEKEEDL